jgi:3-dehydroquinate dehydratase/shikimate dehydrogenase
MKETESARICVPVCVRLARELGDALARAAEVADVIELRMDCLSRTQLDEALRELGAILQAGPKPFILTFRPAEEGGARSLELHERIAFWHADGFRHDGKTLWPEMADLEFNLLTESDASFQSIFKECLVICSHHDFDGINADLSQLYERMAATRADVLKLAFQVDDVTECLKVFEVLERARRDGRRMIAVAMGDAGIITRILGPSRGSFLTYGSLDSSHATAPGQLSARELRDVYRVHLINRQTEIMGLVGQPVVHSVSPHIHNAAFAAAGRDAVYLPLEVSRLERFMRMMAHPRTREMDWSLRGLSVTAPHKREIMQHLDWVEDAAREIGAVNTIVVRDAELHGYNTDASAALAPVREEIDLNGARVAVIGAGGAARALLWSLREACARVTVFARDAERARETAQQFDAHDAKLDGASFGGFELVVNATPLGTRGKSVDETPALAEQLRGARIVYDLVYNPRETRFMREALAAGCRAIGGLDMLIAQAAAQFELWTGTDAPLEIMREAGKKAVRKAVTSDK